MKISASCILIFCAKDSSQSFEYLIVDKPSLMRQRGLIYLPLIS